MIVQPANPSYGSGQVIAVTTGSQNVNVPTPSKQIQFTNLGANPAFVRMTPAGAAATTADAVIPPGSIVVYTKFADVAQISIVSTGGATSVHLIPVEGF